ncbi:TMV resistance protein N-like [Mercurialis annua]|uniref:TMV resistance protein N-like n=1 Tax=Mercurialis annua TaxID=3986 RepID=UPI00215ECD65|nr:TMV resistance protein N-like [Mercurialis annua]
MASSSSSTCWIYDVFLSFRGLDVRRSFVSHLHNTLDQKGIYTFKDDKELQKGQHISPDILQAITDSRFSIVIFSENYANSEWCLDELVQCLECMEAKGQTVLPIFYEIDPSILNSQTGSYAEALAKYEEGFKGNETNMKKLEEWKSTLQKAENIVGWDSRNWEETELIRDIIQVIAKQLPHCVSSGGENLVGIDSNIKEIMPLLCLEVPKVHFIGIWGMGGIGKTTIAKVIYDQLYSKFSGCCFLENVKESWSRYPSPGPLQHELLCQILQEGNLSKGPSGASSGEIKRKLWRKKVLIVLDDVNHQDQLNALAEKHDWFGLGSRVIITTRNKHLLTLHGVNGIHEVKTLNNENALKLFSNFAFKKIQPLEEFMDLSRSAIKYAKGLPLALKVLGSFLFSRGKPQWEEKLEEWKSTPDMEILDILRVSYDGLQQNQKDIFLDIACFYKGEDKGYVTKLLHSCGLFPIAGLEVLIEKCFISIFGGKIQMHDLLQEMGRDIVQKESLIEPGKRSRLWIYDDIYHVLTHKSGTEKVQGLILDLSKSEEIHIHTEAFANMKNLRLLIVCNASLSKVTECHHTRNSFLRIGAHSNGFEELSHNKIHLSGDFRFISNELRCFYWHGYPLKSLPSSFYPKNLLELDMSYSHIKQLWDGKKFLTKLEFIDLSYSKSLIKTPNFDGVPNLKSLILESCTSLIEVHSSIGSLKKLTFLCLKGCKSLKNIPSDLRLESLEILILSDCSNFVKFPMVAQKMEHLSTLYLDGTALRDLPSSIEHLVGLVLLDLTNCKNLTSLPNSLCNINFLRVLILSGCLKLEDLPENLGLLKNLETLDVGGTSIKELPNSFEHMENLNELSFRACKGPPPKFWQSTLWFLSSTEFQGLKLPTFLGFHNLEHLDLSFCNLQEEAIPSNLGSLSSLTNLGLRNNDFISLPSSITLLSKLQNLNLSYCTHLQSLPELPGSISYMNAQNCISLNTFSGASSSQVRGGRSFFLTNCFKMAEEQGKNGRILELLKSELQLLLQRQRQGLSRRPVQIDFLLPVSDIPSWFSHQTSESSLTIHLPPCGLSTAKLMGLAVCVNFTVHNHLAKENAHWLDIYIQLNEGKRGCAFNTEFYDGTFIESDHLWLSYGSCQHIIKDWVDTGGYIKVSYIHDSQGLEVKAFGARLIFDATRDVEEIDELPNSPTALPELNVSSKSITETRIIDYVCKFLSCFGLGCFSTR